MSLESPRGVAPWLLWGGEKSFEFGVDASGADFGGASSQIVRVSYGRPETWRFLCFARIDALSTIPAPQPSPAIVVDFGIIVGVGRTIVNLPLAVQLSFGNASQTLAVGQVAYSDTIPSLGQVQNSQDQTTFTTVGTTSQTIVAQDIQATVGVRFFLPGVFTVNLSCAVLFAPNNHVRPDWFAGIKPHFLGGEQEGR